MRDRGDEAAPDGHPEFWHPCWPRAGQTWRHRGGVRYVVVCVVCVAWAAVKENDLLPVIVYRQEREPHGPFWVRTLDDFVSSIDGAPRFVREETDPADGVDPETEGEQ